MDNKNEIPSPFMPNRMITPEQIDKVMKDLGTKRLFIATKGDDNKIFMSVFGFCKHDIAAIFEIFQKNSPPDNCVDVNAKPEGTQPV